MQPRGFKPEFESLEGRDLPQASPWQAPLVDAALVQAAEVRSAESAHAAVSASNLEACFAQFAENTQAEGVAYFFNYAHKSIRSRRSVKEQDRADLVQEVYVEWTKFQGANPAAWQEVLSVDSQARTDLRTSIYRILDRYRYAQNSGRTVELGEYDPPQPTLKPETQRIDDRLDTQAWLAGLPREEASVIAKHYYEHQTIEKIGEQLSLAKQRISEIHRRALASHPEAVGEE